MAQLDVLIPTFDRPAALAVTLTSLIGQTQRDFRVVISDQSDVLAQLRVMARFGGCGLLPSGVYHQELPTTVVERRVDAPKLLPVEA